MVSVTVSRKTREVLKVEAFDAPGDLAPMAASRVLAEMILDRMNKQNGGECCAE